MAQEILEQQGHEIEVFDEPTLADWQVYNAGEGIALVITSTTGQGDFPDTIAPYFMKLKMLSVISLS